MEFLERLQEFGDFLRWPYIIFVMLVAWCVNEIILPVPKEKKKFKVGQTKLNVKQVRSIVIGLLFFVLFYVLEGEYTGHEALRYFCSLIFAMVILWDGLKKWWVWLKAKFPSSSSRNESE